METKEKPIIEGPGTVFFSAILKDAVIKPFEEKEEIIVEEED